MLVGVAILALLRGRGRWQSRVTSAALARSWLWVAWAYAYAFVLEALPLLALGRGLCLRAKSGAISRTGVGLVLFGLLLHPLIGPLVAAAGPRLKSSRLRPIRRSSARSAFLFSPAVGRGGCSFRSRSCGVSWVVQPHG